MNSNNYALFRKWIFRCMRCVVCYEALLSLFLLKIVRAFFLQIESLLENMPPWPLWLLEAVVRKHGFGQTIAAVLLPFRLKDHQYIERTVQHKEVFFVSIVESIRYVTFTDHCQILYQKNLEMAIFMKTYYPNNCFIQFVQILFCHISFLSPRRSSALYDAAFYCLYTGARSHEKDSRKRFVDFVWTKPVERDDQIFEVPSFFSQRSNSSRFWLQPSFERCGSSQHDAAALFYVRISLLMAFCWLSCERDLTSDSGYLILIIAQKLIFRSAA